MLKLTRKGYHKLQKADGSLISQHTDSDEAYQKASTLPDGIYTLVRAAVEIVVSGNADPDQKPEPKPDPVPEPIPEPTPEPEPIPTPEPTPQPTPGTGSLKYLASYPTPTLSDPLTNKTAKLNYGKHTKMAYCPLTGDLYLCGGDGQGQHWGGNDSGALDTVGRYNVQSHAYAMDFDYPGQSGEVVPRGLDFIGFTWSPSLKEFWLGPGYAWDYPTSKYPWRDTAWKHSSYAGYNPITKKFTDRGPRKGRAYIEGFAGSWDTRRNRLVWVENDQFHSLDPATGEIVSSDWLGLKTSHRAETADTRYDEATDEFYFVQIAPGHVYAYHIGSAKLRLVAEVGCTADSASSIAVAYPPGHCLLAYAKDGTRVNPWRLVNLATGEVRAMDLYPEGCTHFNTGCYHPPTGQIVFTGGGAHETANGPNYQNGAAYHHYQWHGAPEVAADDPKGVM